MKIIKERILFKLILTITLGVILLITPKGNIFADNNGEPPLTVTFRDFDNSIVDTIEVEAGNKVSSVLTDDREGYDFIGWYLDISDQESFDFNTVINEDITLYAKYSLIVYEIEYYLYNPIPNDRVDFDPIITTYTVEDEFDLEIPDNRLSADFLYWTLDSNKITKIEQGTTGDLFLVARWDLVEHELKFKVDGVVVDTMYVQTSMTVIELPEEPVKEGFRFLSWRYGNDIKFTEDVLITIDLEIYALFTEIHEINFISNEEVYKTIKVDNGEKININNIAEPVREGYTFDGWYLGLDEFDFNLEITSSFSLYAKWIPKEYDIVYELNLSGDDHSDFIPTKTSYKPNEEVILEIPNNITSSLFVGWYDNSEFNGNPITKISLGSVGDKTFYAKWELREYNVIFVDEDLNLTIDEQVIKYGKVVNNIPLGPIKEGYQFIKWLYTNEFNEEVEFDSQVVINKDLEIKAYYLETVKIDFVSFGITTSEVIFKNDKIEKPVDPEQLGYDFIGWYLDDVIYDFNLEVTNDIVLEAKWNIIYHTVIYHNLEDAANNVLNPEVIDIDDIPLTLEEPTKEGYTFVGWYLDGEFNNLFTELDHLDSLVVFAKWEVNQYEVSFELNGADSEELDILTVTYDSLYGDLPIPTKAGYTFAGWENSDGNLITALTVVKTALDHSLFAKWEIIVYEITYNLFAGENNILNPTTYTVENEDFNLLGSTKEGYTFIGWYLDINFTGDKITKIKQGTIGYIELFARYEIDIYTITYNLDDGNNNLENILEFTIDDLPITLNNPNKTGYTFAGWFLDSELENSFTQHNSLENLIVYTKWEINVYDITYSLNEGTNNILNPNTYTIKTETIILEEPFKEGYSFNGWFLDDVLTTEIIIGSYGNIVLEALFTKNEYIVNFDINEGQTAIPNNIVVTYDNAYGILADSPKREGYTFVGWYLDDVLITEETIVKTSTDHTLVAEWNINLYTYTFYDWDQRTVLDTQTIPFNSEIELPNSPHRDGNVEYSYVFDSWFPEVPEVIKKDISFYAVYNEVINKYTYTFLNEDQTVLKEVKANYGSVIVEPNNLPTKESTIEFSYEFVGWDIEIPDRLEEDITFVAVFNEVIRKYTVTLKDDDEIISLIEVEYNTKIDELINPIKEHYEFINWYLDIEFMETFDSTTLIIKDITIYAKWLDLILEVKNELRNDLTTYINEVGSPTNYLVIEVNRLVSLVDELNYQDFASLVLLGKESLLIVERNYAKSLLDLYLDDFDTVSIFIENIISDSKALINLEQDINEIKSLARAALTLAETQMILDNLYNDLDEMYSTFYEDEKELYDQASLDEINTIYQQAESNYNNGLISKEELQQVINDLQNIKPKETINEIRPGNGDDVNLSNDDVYGFAKALEGFVKGTSINVLLDLDLTNFDNIENLIFNKELNHMFGNMTEQQIIESFLYQEVFGKLEIHLLDNNENIIVEPGVDEYTVYILLPEELRDHEDLRILFVDQETAEVFDVVKDGKWISFKTNHFSTFYLIGKDYNAIIPKEFDDAWWIVILMISASIVLTAIIVTQYKGTNKRSRRKRRR